MPLHARQIDLMNVSAFELWLHEAGDTARLTQHNDSRRVRVQPVRHAQVRGAVDPVQNEVERVAVESSAGVHRQRCRLVDHNDRIVFVQNFDPGVDARLDRAGDKMIESLALTHDVFCCSRSCRANDPALFDRLLPVVARNVRMPLGQEVEQR